MGRGWEGVVLKLFRGKDFVFTVTGAEQVTERYRRVHFTDGGMLEATGVHPTMWVRLWFDNAGKPHQRAYTLVDPDVEAGFVWIACDTATTRALTSYALKELAIPKTRIHSLGYWRAA